MNLPDPPFAVEFKKDGTRYSESQAESLIRELAGPGRASLTDLLVISHGWNNDLADATSLYDCFFQKFDEMLQSDLVPPELRGRGLGVLRIFWPSKKFADGELIPGGGQASATGPNDEAAAGLLNRLKNDPERLGGSEVDSERAAQLDKAILLLTRLDTAAEGPADRARYVEWIRECIGGDAAHADDGSDAFFELPAEQIFDRFGPSVQAPSPTRVAGGAAALNRNGGGAAGLGDLLIGARSSARRIANFATYYQMKKRAGMVGELGLAPLLRDVQTARPELRVHLIGHSFGARVVTAAAHALPAGTLRTTMTLLQGAYSHNGLAEKFDDKGTNGFFRALLAEKRISGPIAITHTKADRAVGIAYPLASRIARDRSSALGDRDDPFGGMGRNGAQRTPEVDTSYDTLLDIGAFRARPYRFREGAVYNLNADGIIGDHSDICRHEVAALLLSVMAAVG